METTKQNILNDIEVFNDRIQIAQDKLDALPHCVTGWRVRKRIKMTRQALEKEIEHFKHLVGYSFVNFCKLAIASGHFGPWDKRLKNEL